MVSLNGLPAARLPESTSVLVVVVLVVYGVVPGHVVVDAARA
jgi:hypothetical protein